MDGEGRISDYRSRLDKTLTSPELMNEEMVHILVKNQILQTIDSQAGEYTDCAIERRSNEVFKFLCELRSASTNDSNNKWKVKQDTEELRVMYREGPEGTPFHTLLAEGYVDGPVDVCLCISSDADLYKKWWPQITVPTFKVAVSHRVQRVIDGEQTAIVRMKLSWPMSGREVIVHYFTFEYFKDGLVVVILNSISDSETIERSTHGFTRDGMPDAEGVVRMDLYGGFALKKITADRSFFRTIANLDIKLDFVPPAFINFVARQLVGSGFKLYKKQVASAKGNIEVQEALKDPLYARVREALYKDDASLASRVLESTHTNLEQQNSESFQDNNSTKEDNTFEERNTDPNATGADARDNEVVNEIEEFKGKSSELHASLAEEITVVARTDLEVTKTEDPKAMDAIANDNKVLNEIKKFEERGLELHDKVAEEITVEVRTDTMEVSTTEVEQGHEITEHFTCNVQTKVSISPEVQRALGTLEKAISIFREYNSSPVHVLNNGDVLSSENDAATESISWEADEIRKRNQACVKSSKLRSAQVAVQNARSSSDNLNSRRSNSSTRETNQSKIAPDEDGTRLSHNQRNVSIDSESTKGDNMVTEEGNRMKGGENKKLRFCCLSFGS
ncbi:uncharacterized protein LOC121799113 [Salvia splendens]|uniref:uncharacterized protein LOC121799113 n=1 Tax=Salvia splendens TaxID=180675 RepID=UPI001C275E15|nr:uncharacterized protein LOC121799113 [Salvia splendens]XP_042054389.1 uncharacterized protein LOC121799113 [Salvia splendens]